jgi:hypothetical protein
MVSLTTLAPAFAESAVWWDASTARAQLRAILLLVEDISSLAITNEDVRKETSSVPAAILTEVEWSWLEAVAMPDDISTVREMISRKWLVIMEML